MVCAEASAAPCCRSELIRCAGIKNSKSNGHAHNLGSSRIGELGAIVGPSGPIYAVAAAAIGLLIFVPLMALWKLYSHIWTFSAVGSLVAALLFGLALSRWTKTEMEFAATIY
jgi:hypothetical protein